MTDQLDEYKKKFGVKEQPQLSKLLVRLSRRRFKDPVELISFHENLLFILAYPQSKKLLVQTRKILRSFPQRVKYLEKIGGDMTSFDDPEVSGVAGTTITIMAGYKFARWLSENHTRGSEIDWLEYEEDTAVAAILPRVLPLLEEEGLVEAHISFVDYIHAARTRNQSDLAWLMKNFSELKLSEKQTAELYESLKLFVRFIPTFKSSRTGLVIKPEQIFYHTTPLIQRRDISVDKELQTTSLIIEKLPPDEGIKILDIIRTASVVRYRELHGFIWCDVNSFFKIDVGRGVVVFINEVLPENRLPVRAYHSGFIFKNGVPIGYVEGISIFEKMEVGFNLYYTFRDGETAWLFAQLLKIFRQHLGMTVFTIDPYQIGHENEEGIESGAFWFYRKLGFQPMLDDVVKIVETEEKKLAKRKEYRTPGKTLRLIAKSHLIFGIDESKTRQWKGFQIRNILLAVQENIAAKFKGKAANMRSVTTQKISRDLGGDIKEWSHDEQEAFSNFACILSLIPGYGRWPKSEKELMIKLIRAKGSGSEIEYLHLMQQHDRLREALLKMGT